MRSSFVVMISLLERVLHSIIASHVVLRIRRMAPRGYLQNGSALDGATTEAPTTDTGPVWFASYMLRSDNEPENQGNRELEGTLKGDSDDDTSHSR
ncbi:hypothetical protein E1B28_010677 [Marasmius oreades]|uniref:Secreted protein n=1 Tax=Marasmius oreades TaxID=181124 RepID=A0A9P7RYT3_9AGAR|nr:uncharacterized protein E1B28_010677 [Marasmius oreades]KAG7091656.1 hypothetical protein E1B28_010677 [Marasmius oreades]